MSKQRKKWRQDQKNGGVDPTTKKSSQSGVCREFETQHKGALITTLQFHCRTVTASHYKLLSPSRSPLKFLACNLEVLSGIESAFRGIIM